VKRAIFVMDNSVVVAVCEPPHFPDCSAAMLDVSHLQPRTTDGWSMRERKQMALRLGMRLRVCLHACCAPFHAGAINGASCLV
jgi:hypothetical protein